MNRCGGPILIALLLTVLWGGHARAEMMPFRYDWAFGPIALDSSGVGTVTSSVTSTTLTLNHDYGTFNFTLAPPGLGAANLDAGTPTYFPIGSLTGTASGGTPPGHLYFNARAQLSVRLKETLSGQGGELDLFLYMSGHVSPTEGTFLYAEAGGMGFADGLRLGDHLYGVLGDQRGRRVWPNGSAVDLSNALYAFTVPEPSGLALAAAGLSLLGARRWCRRPHVG